MGLRVTQLTKFWPLIEPTCCECESLINVGLAAISVYIWDVNEDRLKSAAFEPLFCLDHANYADHADFLMIDKEEDYVEMMHYPNQGTTHTLRKICRLEKW